MKSFTPTVGRGDKKVVRKILDRETQASPKEHYSEISDRNYEFAFLREENLESHLVYILRHCQEKGKGVTERNDLGGRERLSHLEN